MGRQILVRNIPSEVQDWIEALRFQYRMTQQEFVLSVLKRVSETQIPLFPRKELASGSKGAIPFKFVDLFAGIGGFRLALENLGGTCLFSSEWDKYAQKTYKAWFDDVPHGDIRKIKPSEIPDHDLLAAGFPCQPFSIAGVSKKKSLGRDHGFKDATQGTLFFNLATIIEIKRPPILFLENVKNLQSHDSGQTWDVIQHTLESMGYWLFHKVIDAAGWVPQHRERIYIVGFDKRSFFTKPPFEFPNPPTPPPTKLFEILEPSPHSKYTLTDHLWTYLQDYAERHRAKGNGFGFGLAKPDHVTRTLSARYYKDGSEILIPQRSKNPRRLTPRECARLMGFPDELPIVVSDTQAYRQFGNAVVPKVVEAIGKQIQRVLSWHLSNSCLLKQASQKRLSTAYEVSNL
jgi:DNA (cytosine-5)-methyltransferase 1